MYPLVARYDLASMKAILLAGGFGTRLRPLTLHTPKPVVPIFDRPFLYHQIQLLKTLPEVDEVILSLNYRPERIEQVIGDGSALGLPVRYMVEPEPLGTGGAIKYAAQSVDDTLVVFNGDVLTDTDLPAMLRTHRENKARATIVLTAVPNPQAYGLVETDERGQVRRFLEKPEPNQVTCDTINAGLYVLEPETFDRIPSETKWSIERQYFPSLVDRGETFMAHLHRGYWIDIGTPEKYLQAHRDIMTGRCAAYPFLGRPADDTVVANDAIVANGATLVGPCYIASGATVAAGARIGPQTVVGTHCVVEAGAVLERSVLWPESTIGTEARVDGAILGRHVRLDEHASAGPGVVIGDGSHITAHTRLAEATPAGR